MGGAHFVDQNQMASAYSAGTSSMETTLRLEMSRQAKAAGTIGPASPNPNHQLPGRCLILEGST